MSLLLLTDFFAGGSLLSAGCCCLLEVAMVLEIRRGLQGWQPARTPRDIAVTFRSHRRFYPASPLRAAFVASSFLMGCCIAGVIVIHRVQHGL
ncbi:MAG: hypothetical protein WB561_03315 [Terracidiphilus sp.]